jgi:SAM-dependent methyltransferase
MVDPSSWTPDSIDVERPSVARIYDYLLGGAHNFASDREVARQALAVKPDLRTQAFANRDFLGRAVEYLSGLGIRQFLDIGSGIPTVGNVHEIARRTEPQARVTYVDRDPVAVAHAQAILAGDPYTAVIQGDLRDPERVLAHPNTRAMLDLEQPVAVLLVAILHVIPDSDDPYGIVAALHRAVAPGSYLVIAHGTADEAGDEATGLQAVSRNTDIPLSLRSRSQVTRFFDGWDLVDPGVVWAPQWHPRPDVEQPEHPHRAANLVGVGRRPS